MFGYCPVLKLDKCVDSKPLHEEFTKILKADLSVVNKKLSAWKGVCVFEKGRIDRISELPSLQSLIDMLGKENILMVNYYNLSPHSNQHPHRDMYGNSLLKIARIHIPIQTNQDCFIRGEDKKYHMAEGEM